MEQAFQDQFWVHTMQKQLRVYIDHCAKCREMKTTRHAQYGSLQPILTPLYPGHTITIDFVLALPTSTEGFDTILTVTDKFYKRLALIPGKNTYTAAAWASALLERLMLADWGLPSAIISDRDRKFLSDMWKQLFKELEVELLYSTAYHPATDGQSERSNQTVEIALRFYLDAMYDVRQWPKVLPSLTFEFNVLKSATTKMSPHEVMYGVPPRSPASIAQYHPREQHLKQCRLAVADAIAEAQIT